MIESYSSESQNAPETCNYCGGDGIRRYIAAYVPGTDPFDFAALETTSRLGACRNCRGSGHYDARRDPRLEHLFRDRGESSR